MVVVLVIRSEMCIRDSKEAVDLNLVLEELWRVTQEEMNFLTEAANMEEFSRKNKNVAFVKTPILYREYTTASVLVMEYKMCIRDRNMKRARL